MSESIWVVVRPGKKVSRIVGLHEGDVKIEIAGRAQDGEANDALIAFVAETLSIRKNEVILRVGKSSRRKLLELPDGCGERLRQALDVPT